MTYAVYHANSIQVAGDFSSTSAARRWIVEHGRRPYYRGLSLGVATDESPVPTEEQLEEQEIDRAVDRMMGR